MCSEEFENAANDRWSLKVNVDYAKNNFIALHLNRCEPFNLTVGFKYIPIRRKYVVGLDYCSVAGFLEGCEACLDGTRKRRSPQEVRQIIRQHEQLQANFVVLEIMAFHPRHHAARNPFSPGGFLLFLS